MRSLLLVDSQASLFGRVIGGAGFQLINVNNVSLRLGGWQTDTQLLSRKALGATLARHYRDEVIKEAHKVRPDISAECVRHQLRIHAMASGCCPSCEASTQLYTHCSAHAALNPLQPPRCCLGTWTGLRERMCIGLAVRGSVRQRLHLLWWQGHLLPPCHPRETKRRLCLAPVPAATWPGWSAAVLGWKVHAGAQRLCHFEVPL